MFAESGQASPSPSTLSPSVGSSDPNVKPGPIGRVRAINGRTEPRDGCRQFGPANVEDGIGTRSTHRFHAKHGRLRVQLRTLDT